MASSSEQKEMEMLQMWQKSEEKKLESMIRAAESKIADDVRALNRMRDSLANLRGERDGV